MRRSEFLSDNEEEFNEITQQAHVGYLGLVDTKGFPRIVPLNFVAIKGNIYFHGASDGEKYELIKSNPKASFSVDIPYAFIPSYWYSKKSAEPTSYFFKSLHIRGHAGIVTDVNQKIEVLNTMMKKYQPEGGYLRINKDEKIYKRALEKVSIFEVHTEERTMKIKFGQNLRETKINQILSGLKERGLEMDLKTIDSIIKYRTEVSL